MKQEEKERQRKDEESRQKEQEMPRKQEEKQSSSKDCICGAKQGDGKKCKNKCRNNGRCGKHGG